MGSARPRGGSPKGPVATGSRPHWSCPPQCESRSRLQAPKNHLVVLGRHKRGPSNRRSSNTTKWVGQWPHQNILPQSPEPTNTCIPAGSDGDGELLPPSSCPTEAKAYLLCNIVSNVPSAVLSRINFFFSVFSLKWLARNFPDLSPCSKFSKRSPQSPLHNRPDLIIQWCSTLFYAL